jgi:hypothetical protein
MKQPTNPQDAIQRIIPLLSAAMTDIDKYINNPNEYSPEYFRDVSAAVGDALLLALWTHGQLNAKE